MKYDKLIASNFIKIKQYQNCVFVDTRIDFTNGDLVIMVSNWKIVFVLKYHL